MILLTGASGFLGSHFLWWACTIGRPAVAVLVRGGDHEARTRKLTRACAIAAHSYEPFSIGSLPELTIVGGDVEQPMCGLASQGISELRSGGIEEFWHFAASLHFETAERTRTMAANVRGAENAVRLAAVLGARRFIYMSTAYSAGAVEGLIQETLHGTDRPFCNPYEESKCYAEHAVLRLCAEHGIAPTILRPSIVIGPNKTKSTGGSRVGLYGLVRDLDWAKDLLRRSGAPIRVPGQPKVEINLMPVDCLMQDIVEVVQNEFGRSIFYHLCAARGPTLDITLATICAAVGIEKPQLVGDSDAPSAVLDLMPDRMQFYRAHARLDRRFERSLSGSWHVTDQDLAGFVAQATTEMNSIANRWGPVRQHLYLGPHCSR